MLFTKALLISLFLSLPYMVNCSQLERVRINWSVPELVKETFDTIPKSFKYIHKYLYDPLIECKEGRSSRGYCNSLIMMRAEMTVRWQQLMSSMTSVSGECKYTTESSYRNLGRPKLLYAMRGSFGIIQYTQQCNARWVVQVGSMFHINITVHHIHIGIMESWCTQRDRGVDWTRHTYNHQVCSCRARLEINSPQHYFCGNHPKSTMLILNDHTSIFLILDHFPNKVNMWITFEATIATNIWYIRHKLLKGKTYGVVYSVRLNQMPYAVKASDLEVIHTQHIFTPSHHLLHWFVTVPLRSKIYINRLLFVCRDVELNLAAQFIFVDGPQTVYDSVDLFRRKILHCSCPSREDIYMYFQSSLNNVAVTFIHTHTTVASVSLTFKEVYNQCVPPMCHHQREFVSPGKPIHSSIDSTETSIYFLTYTSHTRPMAVNVTKLSIRGFYMLSCHYGSVSFYFKNDQYSGVYVRNIEDTLTKLGTYCSSGAIAGLLEVAKPLFLSIGSLENRNQIVQKLCSGFVECYDFYK